MPKAVVGIIIAALVLLPEGLRYQLGAGPINCKPVRPGPRLALATIGLTIPAVAAVSIVIGQPLVLGFIHQGSGSC